VDRRVAGFLGVVSIRCSSFASRGFAIFRGRTCRMIAFGLVLAALGCGAHSGIRICVAENFGSSSRAGIEGFSGFFVYGVFYGRAACLPVSQDAPRVGQTRQISRCRIRRITSEF